MDINDIVMVPIFLQALIVETPSSEPKESSPANLVALKTQTSELRDQIRRIEKDEDFKHSSRRSISVASGQAGSGGPTHPAALKATEKHRKKLAELEAQLVLASPSLLFQVSQVHKKVCCNLVYVVIYWWHESIV